MRIFLRTFNNRINSKTGSPLPQGQYRGTPEWMKFQKLLIETLITLGHECVQQVEHPHVPNAKLPMIDKEIYVHQTKRDVPEGNLFWMQMHMRELFTIDTNGWGADHSSFIKDFNGDMLASEFIHMDMSTSRAFCESLSDKLLASGESKCEQVTTTDMTPDRFILVPVQIPRDYTLKWHSPITVKYFLESIQSWAVETQNHVVFKMHPFNKGDADLHKVVDDARIGSRYIHKVEGNIHELIKRSQGLFVINSGTGFESLIHGKPVCTFGSCDYSLASFNADIRRLDEARNFIYSFKDDWRYIGYQFVNWYWHKHAYDVNATDTPSRLAEYLKGVLDVL